MLKIYRKENMPKSFKIAKIGLLKNGIGDNVVFSRFDGVFQKYESASPRGAKCRQRASGEAVF